MSSMSEQARLAGKAVVVPTRVSARVVRGSVVTTVRTMRFAARSSVMSFVLGLGLGWFLTTPTGRYLLATLRDAILPDPVAPPDDEGLSSAVRSALAATATTWHLPQPEVVVVDGHVTLRGEAPHDQGREALLVAAAGVPGVAAVVDALRVPTASDVSDVGAGRTVPPVR
jgi:hypothetical protein